MKESEELQLVVRCSAPMPQELLTALCHNLHHHENIMCCLQICASMHPDPDGQNDVAASSPTLQ